MNGYPNYTVSVTDNGCGNNSEESIFNGDPMLTKAVVMFKRARIGNDICISIGYLLSGYHADTPITIKAEPSIWPTAAFINIHEHPL